MREGFIDLGHHAEENMDRFIELVIAKRVEDTGAEERPHVVGPPVSLALGGVRAMYRATTYPNVR